MVLQAAKDYDLDMAHSFMVGDMARDVECGENAGIRGYRFTEGRLDDFIKTIVEEGENRERL